MSQPPPPKKVDSLGRNRLEKSRYSQSGGLSKKKFIVYRCKKCRKSWNVASKSHRYDAKCRFCGTRNTILMTLPKTYYKGRSRVTQFEYYPDAETAEFVARKRNSQWMERKIKPQYRNSSFVKASQFNKLTGSIDTNGFHHPQTKEMSSFRQITGNRKDSENKNDENIE